MGKQTVFVHFCRWRNGTKKIKQRRCGCASQGPLVPSMLHHYSIVVSYEHICAAALIVTFYILYVYYMTNLPNFVISQSNSLPHYTLSYILLCDFLLL